MSLLLENIRKTYRQPEGGRLPVLGIDQFQLQRGEQAALIGSSGGGKTTLLNIIAGILTPDSGRVVIDGRDIVAMPEVVRDRYRAARIGIVFQTFNLLARSTALTNVELPLVYAGLGRKERAERAKEALRAVDLLQRMHHKPNELSGGQRQRVAIARAISKRPDVLLCDEPTGALDIKTGKLVLEVLERVNRETGTIVTIITHNAAIAGMADRVVRMSSGGIAAIQCNAKKVSPAEIAW